MATSFLGRKIQVEDKEQIKKRQGKPPDLVYALALAWASGRKKVCVIRGCGALAVCGDYCVDCATELQAMYVWEKRKEQKREVRELLKCLRKKERKERLKALVVRLEGLEIFCVVIAVEWYLLWQYRGFIGDCIRLWFGGVQ